RGSVGRPPATMPPRVGRFLHALVAIAVVVPAVAVSTASACTTAKPPPPLLAFSFAGTPTMLVDATGEEGNDGPPAAFAGNPNRFQPPSKVAIRVPGGFPIATGAVGSTLGRVEALASEEDPARSLDSYLLLEGPVT